MIARIHRTIDRKLIPVSGSLPLVSIPYLDSWTVLLALCLGHGTLICHGGRPVYSVAQNGRPPSFEATAFTKDDARMGLRITLPI